MESRRKGKVKYLNPFKFLSDLAGTGRLKRAQEEANRTVEAAEEQKRGILLEAREEALRTRSTVENDLKERRKELQRQERRVNQREEGLDQRGQTMDSQEKALGAREQDLDKYKEEINGAISKGTIDPADCESALQADTRKATAVRSTPAAREFRRQRCLASRSSIAPGCILWCLRERTTKAP